MNDLPFISWFLSTSEQTTLEVVGLIAQIVIAVAAVWGIYRSSKGIKQAHELQKEWDTRRESAANLRAGNAAIIQIVKAFELFSNFDYQFIRPHSNHPHRGILILPPIRIDNFKIDINLGDLVFISSTNHAGLLQEILRFEMNIDNARAIIQKRTTIHEVVQTAIESIGQGDEARFDPEELLEAIGLRRKTELTSLTEGMIKTVLDIIRDSESIQRKMEDALDDLFPERRNEVLRYRKSDRPSVGIKPHAESKGHAS